MYSTVKSIFHLSYFDPYYPTSGLTVTGLARAYCNLLVASFECISLFLTLIYGLLIDAISSSVYIVSSGRMVGG
jgi:hypothetical protein